MGRKIVFIAMIFGALAVCLGAFGSHALKDMLVENGRMETYKTAVEYHFFHALGLLGFGILNWINDNRRLQWAAYFLMIGTILFSGSLYTLCFTGNSFFGIITPIGGVFLITGWITGAFSVYKLNDKRKNSP